VTAKAGGSPLRAPFRDLVALALLALVCVVAMRFPWSRSALVKLGPNDEDYAFGFRKEGWEREGRTRFHWTTSHSFVELPLHVRGAGLILRMRVRRHSVEPAEVRLSAEGHTFAAFSIEADPKTPYRILEFPLPPLEGRSTFSLGLEVFPPQALGVALDWMEIQGAGGIAPTNAFILRLLLAVLLAFVIPRAAGAGWRVASAHAVVILLCSVAGLREDIVATERILRLGLPVYFCLGMVTIGLLWGFRRALGFDAPGAAGGLAVITLLALTLRLVLLLHPGFYYPDVRVHASFAFELNKRGLSTFLREFTRYQYLYSLGLQNEGGHWYAFPYPPAFYLLCWPAIRFAGCRPEVAVSVVAAAVNSLQGLLVYGMGRRLLGSHAVAVASAAAVVVLPLYLARLSLAYFPALFGHSVDTLVVLCLIFFLKDLSRPRTVLGLALLIALALLSYTQALINFTILLGVFVLLDAALDRTREARGRQVGVLAAGLLGFMLALGLFYGRYVPVFLDMRRGIPQVEEQVLRDKQARTHAIEDVAAPQEDPYTGPRFDLWRGVRKAIYRLDVFYGFFWMALVMGILLVLRRSASSTAAHFVTAWALTYLLLNLASGSLPGPNLLRYNKDLEIVAPLCCIGLGSLGIWLFQRNRPLGIFYGVAYFVFGFVRAHAYLVEKFALER